MAAKTICPNNQRLSGVKEICSYTGRPWDVIAEWIDTDKFPARKLGGRWESWRDLIDKWFLHRIEGEGV